MICPAKLASPGTCLHCGKQNTLILIEAEISNTQIMDNGQPQLTECKMYESGLFCTSCKKHMKYTKKGMYFIPIPPMNDKPIQYFKDNNPFHKQEDE